MLGCWLGAPGRPWASSPWQINPLPQGLRGRSLARKVQEILAGAGTGRAAVPTLRRNQNGVGSGCSLAQGARRGDRDGGRFLWRGGRMGSSGEVRAENPPAPGAARHHAPG